MEQERKTERQEKDRDRKREIDRKLYKQQRHTDSWMVTNIAAKTNFQGGATEYQSLQLLTWCGTSSS